MDADRFDTLSRALTPGHSRRGLTRLLGGALLGGPLAALGLAESEAKRKKKKKTNKRTTSPPPPPPPPPPSPPDDCGGCDDDGFACTSNTCVPALGGCVIVFDDANCQVEAGGCHSNGRCDPSDPNRQGNGCVYPRLANGTECEYQDGNGTTGTCCNGTCLKIVGQSCIGPGGVTNCAYVCDANGGAVCSC